jgi:hypothetical protein
MAGPPPGLSRRRFLALAGAGAGAVALGACGGGDDDEAGTDGSGGTSGDRELVLAPYLQGPFYFTGIESRVIFGLADSQGLLTLEDTPEELEVTILDPDGAAAKPLVLERHGDGLPRAYFPLRVTLDDPGIYTIRAEPLGGAAVEMVFEVQDATPTSMVKPGDQMPGSLTPTVTDARGVDPICTADPVCALHDVTLSDALAAGGPVALLVATPGFCKVAACGPVHDVLLTAVAAHPDIHFLHSEVYQHPHVNPDGDYTAVLTDLRMVAEPVLFLVGSDGVVADRLDSIYDQRELNKALGALS